MAISQWFHSPLSDLQDLGKAQLCKYRTDGSKDHLTFLIWVNFAGALANRADTPGCIYNTKTVYICVLSTI